jgi:VWFA-related protein
MLRRSLVAFVCFTALGAAQPAQPGQVRQQPGELAQPGQVQQPGQLPKPVQLPKLDPLEASIPGKPASLQPASAVPPSADSSAAAEEGPIFRTSVKYVLAPVVVTDRDGRAVTGLTPLDFQLFDNGKPQRITEDVASHPISLVVAIQASAETDQLLPSIRKIGSLLNTLVAGEDGEIAILKYDHRIETLTGFTSDPDQIDAALKKLKPGSTSQRLNDAAMQGLNMLRNRPSNRKRILLLIGESRDYGSEIRVRDVLTEAEFANVVIYTVDMSHLIAAMTSRAEPPRPNPIPPQARPLPGGVVGTATTDAQMNMGNWTPVFKEIFIATKAIFVSNPMEVYTRYSGGREYSYKTQRGLEQAIADIGQELHNQYLLTYAVPPDAEGGFHEIEVRVLKPDLKVRTRNGYWLAGPAAETAQKK